MFNHRKDARDKLTRAISAELDDFIKASGISDDEAEIVRLRFARGWSIVKIADNLKMSERSVQRRIERAYEKIYKTIKRGYLD